ncbi:MAG TPA: MFS transporter, partial [Anaeromyxobacter sp.]|nr:MFS transporter [Anaeromyxobacter sp.]
NVATAPARAAVAQSATVRHTCGMPPRAPPPWTRAVLPFAGAYFLSYLFRTANGVIGPVLRDELSLSASAIGLLTAAYFLAFGLAQLPLGVLLDRFGARRVESALLLAAAAGAGVFAASPGVAGLAAGRALVGLGVSSCFMGALKSFSWAYGPERQASLTGWIMTAGGLGAITSSQPMELALRFTGWRQIFGALAVATAVASAWLFLRAPDEERAAAPERLSAQWRGVGTIFRSASFWRCVPLGVTFTGGFMAVQGLWASEWLLVVNGYGRDVMARHLTGMNVAMLCGYLAVGLVATSLARRGIGTGHLVGAGAPAAIATLVLIVTEATPHTGVLWAALGAFTCSGTLLYPVNSRPFPVELAGRASTALNVTVFVGAFAIQWGMGAGIDALRARGMGTADAHRAVFWALAVAQALAWAWFLALARTTRAAEARNAAARRDTRAEATG